MRVAEEMGTMIGREVGYRIRFDDCTDHEKTAIKVSVSNQRLLNVNRFRKTLF